MVRKVVTAVLIVIMSPIVILWMVGASSHAQYRPTVQSLAPVPSKAEERKAREDRILEKAIKYCESTKVSDAAILQCVRRETL